ncbi:hypothetical protein PLICRDRAFT_117591 [Plicaturopsis crispa FD-325 SS-3]|uniref:Tyrosinase copper-binding domain-containing protein n=1 Tax=Plicaturopsis crispa FD-325 SS-3 TaxID=944288 RepID=A0A0C9SRH3_PLICR|nr:hypothetical protein PLICRDRAFT_117591 [Plicaturopsis crispa FD-325 SS-3]
MFSSLSKLSALVAVLGIASTADASPTCTKPAVRKNWNTLSKPEKTDFLNSIKCLAKLPHNPALKTTFNPEGLPKRNESGSFYDDIIFMHMDISPPMHTQGLFLPWHRWYINAFEGALKDKCGFKGTLPYWDWTKDAADFEHASVYMDDDEESGFGGWGDPKQDFQITTGAFKDFHVSYPNYHRVRRNFTLQPYFPLSRSEYPIADLKANETFSATEVQRMIGDFDGDYQAMSQYIDAEQGARWAVHLIAGGDFADACPTNAVGCTPDTKWSANDPLFWIHHAFLDKIWSDWQNHNVKDNFNTFAPGATAKNTTKNSMMVSDGMFEATTFGNVIDTKGGFLCYTYE